MESPDSPMEGDDVQYACQACGIILEEGKAFELGCSRWHLDCFRCNLCSSLLDSDANLLLLGDGSLICNNCTYSCSACGNKIEDLAILTGDKAYCATCFRCRNCKRKIENLRYARTSHGIFCMSCHETLMARRRKRTKAASSKAKEQSTPLTDKSLPALPPSAILQAFTPNDETPSTDHTELSPRPQTAYDPSSRGSSRAPDRSTDKDTTTLSATAYRGRRGSGATVDSEANGDDSFFIPLALDPSPGPAITPRSGPDTWREAQTQEQSDYFNVPRPNARSRPRDPERLQDTPAHIAFQEKPRAGSSDYGDTRESSRKPSLSGASSARASPLPLEGRPESVKTSMSGRTQPVQDKFRLQDVPKGRRGGSRSSSASEDTDAPPRQRSIGNSNVRKEVPPRKEMLAADKPTTPRTSESRNRDDENAPSPARNDKSIARKEVGAANRHAVSSSDETTSSAVSSPETPGHGVTPSMGGKPIAPPVVHSDTEELVPPTRALNRPPPPAESNSYMQPRNAPAPPKNGDDASSPKLPRWSAGGEFTMDEDMARILGSEEAQHSLLRRVSNAVRHGRNNSESSVTARGHARSFSETTRTTASPRWPKTPNDDMQLTGSVSTPVLIEETSELRRQLRSSEQRVAELERHVSNASDLKNLNKRLLEKRKTVSVLDSQAEIMIRQLEVLAGFVERAKDNKQSINIAELEESAIKDFVQKLERLKQTMSGTIEELYEERDAVMEEKESAAADRDRALMEFEQLSNRNAQLADMNNDLTHQIQEKFKAQSGSETGLGIYTHSKDKSTASVTLDDTLRPLTGTTAASAVGLTPDGDGPESALVAAPHVVNIRKYQAKKFNWKRGGQSVAKGVSKGFKGAFSSSGPQPGQPGDIGLPYNMTVTPVDSMQQMNGGVKNAQLQDHQRQGFGLFKKSTTTLKMTGTGLNAAEHPSYLFGSDLVDRADFERRQIPSIVTRCIEEVELRGMDLEGIYRKTGGNSQVKSIQEGFEKTEDFDISDPGLDITAVTSVLKQYFRKLPTPLLTFDVYDRILESNSFKDDTERCAHLRSTVNSMPAKHRDCLEFLIFHLARVAQREKENLMSPKNLAVVFAPTIMRDHNIEREMTDMHSKNIAVQFIIEQSIEIFGSE